MSVFLVSFLQQKNRLVSDEVDVPHTNYSLTLSEDPSKRDQNVKDFASRCTGILQEAVKWAPTVTRSFLQVLIHYCPKSLKPSCKVCLLI